MDKNKNALKQVIFTRFYWNKILLPKETFTTLDKMFSAEEQIVFQSNDILMNLAKIKSFVKLDNKFYD